MDSGPGAFAEDVTGSCLWGDEGSYRVAHFVGGLADLVLHGVRGRCRALCRLKFLRAAGRLGRFRLRLAATGVAL